MMSLMKSKVNDLSNPFEISIISGGLLPLCGISCVKKKKKNGILCRSKLSLGLCKRQLNGIPLHFTVCDWEAVVCSPLHPSPCSA